MPKVSICLPSLNTRQFLEERMETIFSQTVKDWELIVCDGYSDDGSWEYIQDLAAREPRMRISQTPRKGVYAAFNDCIQLARGEHVYIATSDDTMSPDFLEKMLAALHENPDCGLCQCALVLIDEKGVPYPAERQWNHYPLGAYDENLVSKKNKRLAPHDGILFPALFTIYTSVTQLLIRRTVFDRIGLFEGRWGSMGDYEWGMRAGLVENCIYIPEKLATWRLHPTQATQNVNTPGARLKMIEMARAAFGRAQVCEERLKKIDVEEVVYFLKRDFVELGYQAANGKLPRLRFLLGQLIRRPHPTLDHLTERLQRKTWGQSRCTNRYRRLSGLLKKYQVRSPVFY